MRGLGVRRFLGIAIVLLFVLGSCAPQDYGSNDLDKVKRDIPDAQIEKVRKKIERENRPPAPPKQDGKIVLTVEDGTGLARPFIQIRVRSKSGLTTIVLMTDAKGKARASVTAGTWYAEVMPGCQETMNVTFADARTLKVAPKGTARATLRTEATRRYMAGAPVKWDIAPPWSDDRIINLRVRWIDRCGTGFKAREDFSELVFVGSSGRVRLFSAQTESDAKGWVRLEVGCGPPDQEPDGIWFEDRFNDKDRVNVLSLVTEPAGGWCA